jgi:DNA repair protein RadA/Sms
MKKKTVFVCSSCQHQETKWLGRCPQCGTWNSFSEETVAGESKAPSLAVGAPRPTSGGKSVPLAALEAQEDWKFDSGIGEVNQVLGGGVVRGATVLVGGEPGIGKSTLMLQLAAKVKTPGRVLYVSGEESAAQLKMRADRLGLARTGLEILIETHVPVITGVFERIKPVVIIIDSIQTLYNADAGDVPGTVNQLKYGCHEIIGWAKEHEAAVFLIAHVTKGGQIAGPKLIEHMVDTVLHFEQAAGDVRILRATKNRFGSVDEVGLFTMDEKGLSEVTNPEALFLIRREGELPPGIAVAPIFEGSRALLVEIQALTVPAKGGLSRISSDRIDATRVSRVAAVLEKHTGVRFSDQDVYVNVAGGMRINDPGAELPLALALYSARTGTPLPNGVAAAGELSLAGEVRPTTHLRRRIKAAADLGYPTTIVPGDGGVRKIQDAVKAIWGPGSK